MTFPAAIFWALALYAIASKSAFYVYFPWLCLPFGALAVVDPNLTFGSTVLPVTVAASVFIAKSALRPLQRTVMWRAAVDLRRLGLFSIFALYAVASAYAMPRLFAGHVAVLPLRMLLIDQLIPLAPTSSNFTQAAYVTLSWLFALAITAFLTTGSPADRRSFVRALFAGGSVLAATGVIDYLGGKGLMGPLRNGTYAIAGYTQIGEAGRITGAFSEAAAFGSTAVILVSFLIYSRPVLATGLFKRFFAPVVIGLLLFLSAAATSSTAYGGLAVLIAYMALFSMAAAISGRAHRHVTGISILAAACLGSCAILIWYPSVATATWQLLDLAVFHKTQSLSFAERSYWTRTGYQVFWQTWGVGAGPGTTRVSSWPAAIASNLGVIGICSMGALIILTFLRQPASSDPALPHLGKAGKVALSVNLAMGYLAGTTIDPGLLVAVALAWTLASATLRLQDDNNQKHQRRWHSLTRPRHLGREQTAPY